MGRKEATLPSATARTSPDLPALAEIRWPEKDQNCVVSLTSRILKQTNKQTEANAQTEREQKGARGVGAAG